MNLTMMYLTVAIAMNTSQIALFFFFSCRLTLIKLSSIYFSNEYIFN